MQNLKVWQGKIKLLSNSSVFKYGTANIIPRSVGLFGTLILTPLIIHHLGVVDYGIWILATLIPSLITSPDFGITYGIVNEVARTYQRDGHIKADQQRLLGLYRLLVWIAGGWFILGSIFVTGYILFGNSNGKSIQVFLSLLLALTIFVFGIPTTLWSRVQLAMERGHEAVRWEGVGKVAGFVASILVLLLVPNLLLLIATTLLPTVIAAYVNAIHFRRSVFSITKYVNSKSASLRTVLSENRNALNAGLYFFLAQIAYLTGTAIDPFLVNHFLRISDVSYLSVARRPFDALPLVVTLFSTSLWPVFNRLNEDGQIKQTISILSKLLIGILGLLTLFSLSIIFFNKTLYGFLSGGIIQPRISDLSWIAIRTTGNTVFIILNNYLYAVNLIKIQSWVLIFGALLALLFKIITLKYTGLHSYFIVNGLSYLILSVLPLIYLTILHINQRKNTLNVKLK